MHFILGYFLYQIWCPFFLQCEKKRKGFITKGPKSKSLSTGKILIAVKLDTVWHGIDTINVEVSDRT